MLDAGLNIQINMIVGYPTETVEECRQSLSFLKREVALERMPKMSVFPFVLFRNIGVYRKRKEYGLRISARKASSRQLFPKDIFMRYTQRTGMTFSEVAKMAYCYARAFEKAHGLFSGSRLIKPGTLLTAGYEIAGVKTNLPLSKGLCASSRRSMWLLANFDRGSFHPYPLRLESFFKWIIDSSVVSFRNCLNILEQFCGINRSRGEQLINAMVRNGILAICIPSERSPTSYLKGGESDERNEGEDDGERKKKYNTQAYPGAASPIGKRNKRRVYENDVYFRPRAN
jgi:hypothetical protein